MAEIHIEFGSSRSKRGDFLLSVQSEFGQIGCFSLSLSREERFLLLGLNSRWNKRLDPLLLKGKDLTFVWTKANGKLLSLSGYSEEIPPIEEMRCFGTWKALLGAVLSERDR